MAVIAENRKAVVEGSAVAVVLLTAVLYTVSCFLPATSIGSLDGEGPALGLAHLMFGWFYGFGGLAAWSANIVLWAAAWCLLGSRFRAAAVLGVFAALLGLTTLTSFKADGRYSGYYLWQSSQIVFAIGAVILYRASRLRT